jgi:hypothetical protein
LDAPGAACKITWNPVLEHFSCSCGVFEVVQGGFFLMKNPSSFVASAYSYWRTALPPPVFWTQNTCFHELADCVALQNRQNKGVARKIV